MAGLAVKSVWSDEYRAAVARARGPYLRMRRGLAVALAVMTPLFLGVAAAGYLARDRYPVFGAFVFAAPVFLAFDWIVTILFLRRLAAARDAALRRIDAEYRGAEEPRS